GTFFTLTTASLPDDELIFARAGANDPNFNLRHDPVFIQRRKAKSTVFASVIESHGTYNPVSEIPLSPYSGVEKVEILLDDPAYTAVEIRHRSGKIWTVLLSNVDNSAISKHSIKIKNQIFEWQGPFNIQN
ncbi:MAG: heparinase, partial [Phaeodactylibacter sp.]|nr:heparinase [Phaeodactylibacter sp.]